jgi:hypothetical protein
MHACMYGCTKHARSHSVDERSKGGTPPVVELRAYVIVPGPSRSLPGDDNVEKEKKKKLPPPPGQMMPPTYRSIHRTRSS